MVILSLTSSSAWELSILLAAKFKLMSSNKIIFSWNSSSLKKDNRLIKLVLKEKSIKYFFIPSANKGSTSKLARLFFYFFFL